MFPIVTIIVLAAIIGIIMNINQAIEELRFAAEQNIKALGEIRNLVNTLNTRIQTLEDAAQNQELPAALSEAIAAVKATSQQLDDVVPDAEPPAPPAT